MVLSTIVSCSIDRTNVHATESVFSVYSFQNHFGGSHDRLSSNLLRSAREPSRLPKGTGKAFAPRKNVGPRSSGVGPTHRIPNSVALVVSRMGTIGPSPPSRCRANQSCGTSPNPHPACGRVQSARKNGLRDDDRR
jgi:hypothetical protein